jgi:Skp family chaperone for outer membrane proteins
MKKTALCLMALGLSLAFHPMQSNATAIVAPSSVVVPTEPADVSKSITRLNEIKDMDKSNLSNSEKRELRKEVKSLKKEIRSNSRGIYLSVGAVIIIVLLLILIL